MSQGAVLEPVKEGVRASTRSWERRSVGVVRTADAAEFRPDGMYRDEVPGTDGIDVRLTAGGQDARRVRAVRTGDLIELRRALTAVERKGVGEGLAGVGGQVRGWGGGARRRPASGTGWW